MFFYQCVNGKPLKELARIDKQVVVIGRSAECDLVIKAHGVSRTHCRITEQGQAFVVEDLGSSLGTLLDGREVTKPGLVGSAVPVKIGELEFIVSESPLSLSKELKTTSMIIDAYLEQFPDATPLLKKALEKVIGEITTLYDLARQINCEAESSRIFSNIMDKISAFFGVKRGFIMIVDNKGQYKPVVVKEVEEYFAGDEVALSKTIATKVIRSGEPFITGNAGADKNLDMSVSIVQYQIHSVLCVPLKAGVKIVGLVYLETDKDQPAFSRKDLYFLQAIGEHIAIILEKERLYSELAEKRVTDEQLRLAQKIQYSILPVELPEFPGIFIDSHCEFAKEIGGDFYDAIRLDRNRVALLIGDVSGKGIPSALLATMGKGIFRAILADPTGPGAALTKANRLIYGEIQGLFKKMFITFFLAVYDAEKRELTYSSAGHETAFIARGNEIIELPAQGMPLAVSQEEVYREQSVELHEGDLFFVYTDGIPELKNSSEEFFEIFRLKELLVKNLKRRELKRELSSGINEFRKGADLSDDLTYLAMALAPELTLKISMPAELTGVEAAAERAEQFLSSHSVDSEVIDEMVIILYEALSNAVKYGRQGPDFEVDLSVQLLNNKIKTTVRNTKDRMTAIPALNLKKLMQDRTAGKRGLPLILNLSSRAFFEYDEEYTLFTFYKNLDRKTGKEEDRGNHHQA
ncbi:MAG: SpoIIE family protein phosphatase [Candidatus Wallbacteria bacterium]|nr:SpoIIE family protein phosphatase [Candidatus Wallbacteria bacterium]